MKLTDVKGIGPETGKKLEKSGISTVEDLALLNPDELKAILECGYKKAKEIVEDAVKLSIDGIIIAKTAKEIEEERKAKVFKISTGSNALDKILGGGIESDSVFAVAGDLGTGKTQLCFTSIVNALKNNKKAIYIETEPSIFRLERIKEIAKHRGVTIQEKDIMVIPSYFIRDPSTLHLAYLRAEKLIQESKDKPIGILCIDSFAQPFRAYYTARESLPDRSKMIFKHMATLQRIASQYNIAILLTGQVFPAPDATLTGMAKAKYGMPKIPALGDSLGHSATVWISFQKVSEKRKEWKATVFDASWLPFESAIFAIGAKGIQDV